MYSRPFTRVIYNSICNYSPISPILYLQGPFFYRVQYPQICQGSLFITFLPIFASTRTEENSSWKLHGVWTKLKDFWKKQIDCTKIWWSGFLPPKNESYAQVKLDHFPTVSKGYPKRTSFKNHHVYRCPQGLEPVIFTANIASNPFQFPKKLPSQNSPNTKISLKLKNHRPGF